MRPLVAPPEFLQACFSRDFLFAIGNVPIDEDQASGNGIATRAQNGAVAFATTHGSVVLTAQGRSPAGDEGAGRNCAAPIGGRFTDS